MPSRVGQCRFSSTHQTRFRFIRLFDLYPLSTYKNFLCATGPRVYATPVDSLAALNPSAKSKKCEIPNKGWRFRAHVCPMQALIGTHLSFRSQVHNIFSYFHSRPSPDPSSATFALAHRRPSPSITARRIRAGGSWTPSDTHSRTYTNVQT